MKDTLRRLPIYAAGMICVSFGIVFCTKCGMGISPISILPYLLAELTGIRFGTMTMYFHFVNILAQYLMEHKPVNIRVLLQIPVAFLFGWLINLIQTLMAFTTSFLPLQLLCLAASIFLTAFGMLLMLGMKLVQNPPDGTVARIAQMTGKQTGTVKTIYDCALTAASILLSLLLLHRVYGFGIATILSALLVGRTLHFLQEKYGRALDKAAGIRKENRAGLQEKTLFSQLKYR